MVPAYGNIVNAYYLFTALFCFFVGTAPSILLDGSFIVRRQPSPDPPHPLSSLCYYDILHSEQFVLSQEEAKMTDLGIVSLPVFISPRSVVRPSDEGKTAITILGRSSYYISDRDR